MTVESVLSKPCGRHGCTNLVTRPAGRRYQFDRATFCSHTCAAASRTDGRVTSKPCTRPGCDATITKDPSRRWAEFERQRFCSNRCAALSRAQPHTPKPCQRCGKEIPPRRCRAVYEKARFCSLTCAGRSNGRQNEPASKPCERDGCTELIHLGEKGRRRFEARRFCSRACALGGAARPANTGAPRRRKAKPAPPPAVPLPVVVRPAWRPEGWPQEPLDGRWRRGSESSAAASDTADPGTDMPIGA